MTQQFLDVAQICARFEEMSGKAVAQAVRCHRFVNASRFDRTLENFLDATLRQMPSGACSGKEPFLRLIPNPIIPQFMWRNL